MFQGHGSHQIAFEVVADGDDNRIEGGDLYFAQRSFVGGVEGGSVGDFRRDFLDELGIAVDAKYGVTVGSQGKGQAGAKAAKADDGNFNVTFLSGHPLPHLWKKPIVEKNRFRRTSLFSSGSISAIIVLWGGRQPSPGKTSLPALWCGRKRPPGRLRSVICRREKNEAICVVPSNRARSVHDSRQRRCAGAELSAKSGFRRRLLHLRAGHGGDAGGLPGRDL